MLTLGTLTYAIIEGPARGWTSAQIVSLFAVAAISLGAFVTVELHRDEPLLELRFFRSPPFSGATSMATLAFAILAGFLFLNTLYLQEVRGDSALMAGVATLPVAVVIAAGAPFTGRIVARHGSRMLMTAAGLFLGGGALVLTQDRVASSYLILATGYVLLGFGFALINPPITNTAVGGMPTAQAGVAAAIATSSRQLGNVLGVAIIGSVVASQLRRSTGPARQHHQAGGLDPGRPRPRRDGNQPPGPQLTAERPASRSDPPGGVHHGQPHRMGPRGHCRAGHRGHRLAHDQHPGPRDRRANRPAQ